MARNVNTTKGAAKTEAAQQAAAPARQETLEQGVERIREVFRQARKMDIRITALDGADRLGNVIEGGVNGYMFALKRGEDIANVPEPILEVLKNAGIAYTELSGWKD